MGDTLLGIIIIMLIGYGMFQKWNNQLNIPPRTFNNYSAPEQPKIIPRAQGAYTPYYEKKGLLTKTEYNFYSVLKPMCDSRQLLICPKIRLEDFINVKVMDSKEKMKYRGYIKSRHVDFIICNNMLNILAAIELDDPSHNTAKAKQTDEFKNELFRSVGIPLFRIKTNSDYNYMLNTILGSLA